MVSDTAYWLGAADKVWLYFDFFFNASNQGYSLRLKDDDQMDILKDGASIADNSAITKKLSSARRIKITRDSSGNFEVFIDGVSQLTVTDTDYTTTTKIRLRLASANGATISCIVQDVWTPSSVLTSNVVNSAKAVVWGEAIYVCYRSSGSAFETTEIIAKDSSSNIPRIVHINCTDIMLWSRDGSPSGNRNVYFMAVEAQTLKAYNEDMTQVDSITLTTYGTCIIPISSSVLLIAGSTGQFSGMLSFDRATMTAETFTEALITWTAIGSFQGSFANWYTKDSASNIYLVSNDLGKSQGHAPSYLFRFTNTDITATLPTISAIDVLSDFTARGIFELNDSIYFFGTQHYGDIGRDAIVKYPNTLIYSSAKERDLSEDDDE
ncbi:MAG: hypothetical protein ABIH23_01315, partial [bacterium]